MRHAVGGMACLGDVRSHGQGVGVRVLTQKQVRLLMLAARFRGVASRVQVDLRLEQPPAIHR